MIGPAAPGPDVSPPGALALLVGVLAFGPFTVVGFYRGTMLLRLRRLRERARGRGVDPRPPSRPDPGAGAGNDPVPAPDRWPRVTVQLPLYDEPRVAARAVRAALALDYPRDRLEIQVLDDSTDDTPEEVARALTHAPPGLEVHHRRRGDRDGFKAGALRDGLRSARGELVAIFDADFVPAPDFLRRVVPRFEDPRVGMVQARWSFLNEEASILTEAQSVLLDAHFGIEHRVLAGSGSMWNFNGTAGVWRRRAITSAGGWRADTLTEDLDLSYRAALRGWRLVYLDDVRVPSEIPEGIEAIRIQQYRWAKGMSQVARLLLPGILTAPLPVGIKLDAVFHLVSNVGYVAIAVASILVPPFLTSQAEALRVMPGWPLVSAFILLTNVILVGLFLATGSHSSHGRLARALRRLVLVVPIGVALSVTGAVGTVAGWLERGGTFERTPKSGAGPHRAGVTMGRSSRSWPGLPGKGSARVILPFTELAMAVYHLGWAWEILRFGRLDLLPLVLVFAPGYVIVVVAGLREVRSGFGVRSSSKPNESGISPSTSLLRRRNHPRFLPWRNRDDQRAHPRRRRRARSRRAHPLQPRARGVPGVGGGLG